MNFLYKRRDFIMNERRIKQNRIPNIKKALWIQPTGFFYIMNFNKKGAYKMIIF